MWSDLVMNDASCAGLDINQETILSEDITAFDPKGLDLTPWETLGEIPGMSIEWVGDFEWAGVKTVDQAVANCRAWYDYAKWDKPFCCMANSGYQSTLGFGGVFDTKMTQMQKPVYWDGYEIRFGAWTFMGAQSLAAGAALFATALAAMQ